MNIANGPGSSAERQLCRLCLGREEVLVDIFGTTTQHTEPLPVRIRSCLQLDVSRVTQHDTLPKWICKQCLEKLDDFTSFRERCKLNERKLLLGEDETLHLKDGPGVEQSAVGFQQTEEDDDENDEEMEMIVIDPSRDYESSNDSLPNETRGAVENGTEPYGTGTRPQHGHAGEEDAEGSEVEEGEEEEEEDEEEELKCDTAPGGGDVPNGLAPHTAGNANVTTPQKTVVYTCKYCDVAFAASSACQLHEMQDHDLLAPYACIFCQYKTSIRMFLITHIRDSHSVTRPYICIQCNKGFLRRSDLKKHTFVHTGVRPYACDQCGKSFSRNTNLKKHMRTHLGVKPHACDICPRSFANKADLIRHRSFHHAQETQHACVRCGAVYTQKDKLYDHERYCMGKPMLFGLGVGSMVEPAKQDLPFGGLNLAATIPPQPPQLLTPDARIKVEEPIANDHLPGFGIATTLSQLPAGNAPHTPPSSKIYSCSKCPKRFLSKVSLRAHQATHPVEANARLYECPACKKQIISKREYDRHLQTHSELKPFDCGTCGKRFSRKDKLHRHERIHQQTDRHFSCPDCSAKFVRKDAYESHLKIHCNPAVSGALFGTMGAPAGQEMMVPMQALHQQQQQQQQHSLLYSMRGGDDGALMGAIDPSIRM
uniref:Protein krueppel n=1 Tax=Anopheles christyi TaxID=43041 RepID=A0A182KBC7_9DIPT